MNALKTWFMTRNARERSLLLAAGAIAIFMLVYMLALAPFYRALDQRAQDVARKKSDLAWMQSVAGEIQSLGANQPVSSGESLVVLVDRTARDSGLSKSLTGQTPTGDGSIRVRLENAAFDRLVGWLGELQQRHGIDVQSASIDRTDKSGLVNASLVLESPGA